MMNYGIIGCGMMGHEHLRNISLLEERNIAAIYEPDRGMAASAFRVVSIAIMAKSLMIFWLCRIWIVLVIVSPNHCHTAQLQQLEASRPMPLLVEKPLFTVVDDQSTILQFAKRYSSPVWVAMEYRYMPPVTAFIERAADATGGIKCLPLGSIVSLSEKDW